MGAHIVIVSGKVDSGKTYYVRKKIHLERRLLVLDTTGEWGDVGYTVRGRLDSLRRLRALSRGDVRSFRLVCQVAKDDCDALLRAVWALQPDVYGGGDPRYHVCMVCEEADLLDWTPRPPSGAHILANYGKRVARPLYLVTRRMALIGPNARANCGKFVLFEQDEPADLDALRKRKGKELVEKVRQLRGHQFIEA